MEASEAVAGLGHNNPPEPTLAERLAVNHKSTIDKVEALAKKANEVKSLAAKANTPDESGVVAGLDDDLVEKMAEIGHEAGKLNTAVDKERTDTTKPLRDEVKEIDSFFKVLLARTETMKTVFTKTVGAYAEAKKDEARRQAAERARVAEEQAAAKLKEAQEASHSVMSDVLLNEAARAEEEAQMAANAAVKAGAGPSRAGGVTVIQSTKFSFEILDSDKIPLDLLRPYIKLADFEKFLRQYVSAHKDTKPLAGVRIFPESKTSFR